jgi:hypothetical protein
LIRGSGMKVEITKCTKVMFVVYGRKGDVERFARFKNLEEARKYADFLEFGGYKIRVVLEAES